VYQLHQTGLRPRHLQSFPSCCAVIVEFWASFEFTGTFTGAASDVFCNLLLLSSLELEARSESALSPTVTVGYSAEPRFVSVQASSNLVDWLDLGL